MGAVLIVLFILFAISRNSDKSKKQKRRRRSYFGKSDWEKTCDDGGKFFNW